MNIYVYEDIQIQFFKITLLPINDGFSHKTSSVYANLIYGGLTETILLENDKTLRPFVGHLLSNS